MTRKDSNSKLNIIFYLVLSLIPILIVHFVSDLPVFIGNWEPKVQDIKNFKFPADNFYPPGSALLLLPFSWVSPDFYIVVFIYYSFSCALYFLICSEIGHQKLRLVALSALPLNPPLVWLCYSSQDTVFELFLVLLFIYSAIKFKDYPFIFSGFLLVQTRPAHWLTFLGISTFIAFRRIQMKRKLSSLKLGFVAFLLLPLTIFVNGFIYGTPSLATESGMTLYFGNHKYTYLAHPKYDLDVFLTKQGHMELNPEVKVSAPDPGNSNQYTKMALDSIQENPREFVLSTMQKIESYVVGIQKIPNLSGEYYLSQDAKSIIIGEERLKWILIIPHLFYELYRLLLLFFLFFAIGYLVFIHKKERIDSRVHKKMFIFLIPWLLGIIPGMLFFTETRYKIVSEILLIPFIMLVLELVLSGSKHSRIEGIDKSFTRPNL